MSFQITAQGAEEPPQKDEPTVKTLHPEPAQPDSAPWDPNGIQDFSLTERSGKTITKKDLLGQPSVVCFIFTRCSGPCPTVTSAMLDLQSLQKKIDFRLVSITVDPEFDTVEVLKKYAEGHGAEGDNWWYLTGDQRAIFSLIHRSFLMPAKVDERKIPGQEVIHSVNLLYMDAEGVVREKYDARDAAEVARLKRVLQGLTPPPPNRTAPKPADPENKTKELPAEPVPEKLAQEKLPSWVEKLPEVNASLNSFAAMLLVLGFISIKYRQPGIHQFCMLMAFFISILFLGSYLVYHGFAGSKHFPGTGAIAAVYYFILITHIVLAASVPVLAVITIRHAFKENWQQHRWFAKLTFPIWLYVSITGVIIYMMLYRWV